MARLLCTLRRRFLIDFLMFQIEWHRTGCKLEFLIYTEVAQVGNVEGVQLLLADHRLGNVNHKDITGWTPVMYAMVGKSEEVLLELVADCRVDLDARDCRGRGLEELARCSQKHKLILSTNK